MTADFVLDTSAVIAYLRDEPGAAIVDKTLGAYRCVMHAVNVGELCYSAARRLPERFSPESAALWIEQAGIGRSHVLTTPFLILSARIRCAVPALSFGDGVAVALAAITGLPLLTTEKAFANAAGFARIELIR